MASMSALVRVGTVLLAAVAVTVPALATDLTLERVALSSGGVGYFEYGAEVDGDAVLPLTVDLDQVDDVLKSVVVFDDRGGVGEISLPGRAPLAQLFRDLPFGPEALDSPTALLDALQGVTVEVSGARNLTGRIVAVVPENQVLPGDQGVVTRHRLTLMTEDGLRQAMVEEADEIVLREGNLQQRLDRVLAAVATHQARDRRTLEVATHGEGRRRVAVAYVAGAPLWKGTWRLTLPESGDRARFQGWAVVENLTGSDWTDIDLTLSSGTPVTFRQALYEAYFVHRPEVPVDIVGRVAPPPADAGTMAGEGAGRPGANRRQISGPALAAMAAPKMAEDAAMMPPPAPEPAAAAFATEARETATQVNLHIDRPVSIAAGHSALVPVIDRELPARQVALYRPDTDDRHPLAAVELTNDGATGLPPGVITVYQRGGDGLSFVGDARLGALPVGEERLVSYAVDRRATIDRRQARDSRTTRIAITDGVLTLAGDETRTVTYTIKAPATAGRTVILEQDRPTGWEIQVPEDVTLARAEGAWRLTVTVAAGETRDLTVTLTRPTRRELAIADMSRRDIAGWIANDRLPEDVRAAFSRVAEAQRAVAVLEDRLGDIAGARRRLKDDQDRLRENLAAVPEEGDLYRRYLDKMGAAEDQWEALAAEERELREDLAAAQRALAERIAGLQAGG